MEVQLKQISPIGRIPHEILEIILAYQSSKFLLQTRAVSKLWKEMSNRIIARERFLTFRYNRLQLNGPYQWNLSFYDIFQNQNAFLPWSKCKFICENPQTATCYNSSSNFIETFGTHLKWVDLEGNDTKTFYQILQGTPNIQRLTLCIYKPRNSAQHANTSVIQQNEVHKIGLKKLKRLDAYFCRAATVENFLFLESIMLPFESGIEFISIILNKCEDGDELSQFIERLGYFLAKIPKIQLEFQDFKNYVNTLQSLAPRKLKVTQFGFVLKKPNAQDHGAFEPLAAFLGSISPHLETMIIRQRSGNHEPHPDPLIVPTLPNLRTLQINCLTVNGAIQTRVAFAQTAPFVINPFPALEKLEILKFGNATLSPFAQCRFDTVVHLNLIESDEHYWYLRYAEAHRYFTSITANNYHQMFPNLKKLKTVANGEGLRYIFSHLRELTHLGLILTRDSSVQEDLNSIFCGIKDVDTVVGKGEEEIRKLREINTSDSLLSLAYLKELTLDVMISRVHASLVMLALLHIQPLDRLRIINGRTAEWMPQKLAAYHHRFKSFDSSEWELDED